MTPDITFIFPKSPFLIDQRVFPPLGILYLSSFLKQYYYNVQCLDLGYGHLMENALANIIGISFTTPQKDEAYKCLEYYKQQGKIVIAGGAHATHMPYECKKMGFDHVIIGEGELRLLQLLSELVKSDDRPNLHFEHIIEDSNLDSLPYPDRESLPIAEYKYYINDRPATPIMTTRGCPGRCSFCARVSKKFRLQSAERTIKEILYVYEKHGFRAFMIYDDVFIASKARFEIISNELSGFSFFFRCFSRSNLITDDICRLMAEMGIVEVGLGVESGSWNILKRNLKGVSPDINLRAVKLLKQYGIRSKTFIIVGLPGESHETMEETIKWIDMAQPDDLDVTIFQPLPGSDIFTYPDRWGIDFTYNGSSQWYKGIPGKYISNVSTKYLTADDLVMYRDKIENMYKRQELLR